MLNSTIKLKFTKTLFIIIPCILLIGTIFLILSVTTDFHGILDKKLPFQLAPHSQRETRSARPNLSKKMTFQNYNPMELSIPDIVEERAKDVEVKLGRINVMDVDTFYREALPPPGVNPSHQSILLLHGANFKSKTWLDLNTINLLAAMGHHVVAIDLPGYGETPLTLKGNKGDYLKEIIDGLHLKNVVIVSPSMSGEFSIPFLIKYSQDILGYVPVAPTTTNEIVNKAPNIATPTLILYGDLDKGLGFTSLNHLSRLPNSHPIVIPNAKHPAYLDQPFMFHTLLYNFLLHLKIQ